MALTREHLVDYMQTELGLDTSGINDDTPLFSSGVIDSFSLVSLITFIEQSEQFRMNPMDVSLDNMDTISRILDYVGRAVTAATA